MALTLTGPAGRFAARLREGKQVDPEVAKGFSGKTRGEYLFRGQADYLVNDQVIP